MKGRSHRLPEPADDWGDGSWTVDCVCGVNFDDGEEMVNCDECGVWVHTRCSRFVKGQTSFACDKCKSKKYRNDSEEKEVAQLLVELPTKTLKMNNPYSLSAPPRSSFRRWTDIPIEERVHVQGVPGGDPALFQGLSSIFTPELWKCTGYVPKKFNFQYKEFPCWEEKQESDAKLEENENPIDRGAGVLFSLSKEIVLDTPVETLTGLREGTGFERKQSPKEMNKREGKNSIVLRVQNGVKREENQLRPFRMHLSKRKKEDLAGYKDRSGKKKYRSADKGADNKRKASSPGTDTKKLEFQEDGGVKAVKIDSQDKNGENREIIPKEPGSDGFMEASVDKPNNILAVTSYPAEDLSRKGLIFSIETVMNSEKADDEAFIKTKSSPETGASVLSLSESNNIDSLPIKIEGVVTALDGFDRSDDEGHDLEGVNKSSSPGVNHLNLKPPVAAPLADASDVQDDQIHQDSNGSASFISLQTSVKVKTEAGDDHPRDYSDLPSSPISGLKMDDSEYSAQRSVKFSDADSSPENHQEQCTTFKCLPSSDHAAQDAGRGSDRVKLHDNKMTEGMAFISGETYRHDEELVGSAGPLMAQEGSAEPKHGLERSEEPTISGGKNPSPPAPPSQRKVEVGAGKSSSTPSTIAISKSSVSVSYKPPGPPASPSILRANHSTKQRVKVNSYADSKKDRVVNVKVRDDTRHTISRKIAKEHSASLLKAPQMSKISHVSASKRTSSDSKVHVLYPSSKASATEIVSPGPGDSASSLQTHSISHIQNKSPASCSSQKGEKLDQSSSQSLAKKNQLPSMNSPAPVNLSATLSDEELALLLHQELNSSPRVPRVPRVRHAGTVPQLASPAATSMFTKRTSSSGGKDHILVSKRKNKEDASKDGSRNFELADENKKMDKVPSSHDPKRKNKEDASKDGSRNFELADENKKMDKVPSSHDQKRQDPVATVDSSAKREACNDHSDLVPSSKKNTPLTSSLHANSGPSSSNDAYDHSMSSMRNSPRDLLDDDAGTVVASAPRTLPGLINEIMSKGKRMTCEELCNAVLPHWHNLRKHNGERYAYSSHLLAVLDCLRNRNEWAQLVDRGPKTNAGRKRRKLDSDSTMDDSEDFEYGKGRISKGEGNSAGSQRDDFPKGKRKARKRRRLSLQGRGIKEMRKRRQRADMVRDEDHSSEEPTKGIFSEDESQEGRACPVESDVSTSSDEMGHVS